MTFKLDPALLQKFNVKPSTDPVDKSTIKDDVSPGREIKKKPSRKKHGVHNSFADFLKDDSAWLYDKIDKVGSIGTNRINVMLQRQLWDLGHSFVMKGFFYQNSEMDVMSIVNDYLNEFEIKTSRQDYLRDFDKCVFSGKALNKHGLIQSGKYIAQRYWIVCPQGLIDTDHTPDYAGLIHFLDLPPADKPLNQFIIVKEAPLLHNNRVSAYFYKTLSARLYDRYKNMASRYQHRSVLNHLLYGRNKADIDTIEHNSTNESDSNPA